MVPSHLLRLNGLRTVRLARALSSKAPDACVSASALQCDGCGKPGHLEPDCPMVSCIACGQPGHHVSQCPFADSRRREQRPARRMVTIPYIEPRTRGRLVDSSTRMDKAESGDPAAPKGPAGRKLMYRITNARTIEELIGVYTTHQASLNDTHISGFWATLSKRARAERRRLDSVRGAEALDSACKATAEMLADLRANPRTVSNVLHALAATQLFKRGPWEHIWKASSAMLPAADLSGYSAQSLSNVAWAFATSSNATPVIYIHSLFISLYIFIYNIYIYMYVCMYICIYMYRQHAR